MPNAKESLLGTLVAGRFRITELLGEGSMGEVYCAEHDVLHRKFAIKVLKTDVEAEPVLVERFRREARAASRLDHPNIVYIADFGQMDNGRLYLAMEYTAGSSLQEEMDALLPDRLPLGRTLEILRQVTDAIGAAHKAQVVHRDLKPDNILLTRDGAQHDRVKILDFGLAKILGDSEELGLTRKGEIFGTPAFISPEQARGDAVDHRSDIYALGTMMYELLSGRLPFEHTNITRMLIAQQEETPQPPSMHLQPSDKPFPRELEDLVLRCLAKAPAERPQSSEEIHTVIIDQIAEAHKLGVRATVRFADLTSLDLGMEPAQDDQQTHPLESGAFADPGSHQGVAPAATLDDSVDVDGEDEWLEQTSARFTSPADLEADLEDSDGGEQRAGADDEKRSWHWQQVCKKAKTIAFLLRSEQPTNREIPVALERHSAAEALVVTMETELALLKDRYDEQERTYREQESALRYALVDLSIERGRLLDDADSPPGPLQDLDFQIEQLEARISDAFQAKERQLGLCAEQSGDCRRRLENLQQVLADCEVELVRLVRSLCSSARSPKAHRLYDALARDLRKAR